MTIFIFRNGFLSTTYSSLHRRNQFSFSVFPAFLPFSLILHTPYIHHRIICESQRIREQNITFSYYIFNVFILGCDSQFYKIFCLPSVSHIIFRLALNELAIQGIFSLTRIRRKSKLLYPHHCFSSIHSLHFSLSFFLLL